MPEHYPKIDGRTAADIAQQVKGLLRTYAPEWKETYTDPDTKEVKTDRLGLALIAVFARFAELIIERLNRAPEKNFLAFLDLLGAARLPPQPARVPLAFSVAEGTTVDAVVPAGTQVGATPPAGDGQALLYETERDLVVTSARLQALFARDPVDDRYADRTAILEVESTPGLLAFQGEQGIDHSFYLGHRTLLGCTAIQSLTLDVTLETPGDLLSLRWEIWDGKEGIKLSPKDDTKGLSKNGSVAFENPVIFPEATLPMGDKKDATLKGRWLRCRLETAITLKWDDRSKQRISAVKLPAIKGLVLSVVSAGAALDAACTNTQPLDLGKEIFPFGEKPKLGDSFYLAHREAFSRAGARVALHMTVVDPKTYRDEEAIPNERKPTLVWESWNGQAWAALTPDQREAESFTTLGPRTVEFTVPAIQPATINGVDNYWIRVRIEKGDYGKDAEFGPAIDKNGKLEKENGQIKYQHRPSTLVPPQLAGLTVGYTQEAKPEAIITVNDFLYEQKPPGAFQPFLAPTETSPALYLGFRLPVGRAAFPNRPLSLYFAVAETEHRYDAGVAAPGSPPPLAWEYWNGKTWALTSVQDETEALAHSGLAGWLAPADIAPKADFGLPDHYWLRLRLAGGDPPHPPRLRRLLLNTTMAAQTMSLVNEILGSSDGNTGQRFRANHTPVLPGQRLEVEEEEMPTAVEQAEIRRAEGEDAIRTSEAATARGAVWARWHEVPDFYASGTRDRHYVLDPINGEVRFGDGQNGLVPPRGVGNIRLARYRTGGGARGNVPAGAIAELKTTLPYVDRVQSPAPALGGADPEPVEALRMRTPRQLRHGGRAVTRDDYEDLALLASPEVARARCVPLWDRSKGDLFDPGQDSGRSAKEKHARPGHVTVIIVPHSADAEPQPSIELVRRVRAYLDDHRLPGVKLHVIGPQYLAIGITAEIAPASPEAAIFLPSAIENALAGFLHPLSGGATGAGWPWGRDPGTAALYKAIHAIPGVGQVRTLEVKRAAPIKDLEKTGYFLVRSGQHKISLVQPS